MSLNFNFGVIRVHFVPIEAIESSLIALTRCIGFVQPNDQKMANQAQQYQAVAS